MKFVYRVWNHLLSLDAQLAELVTILYLVFWGLLLVSYPGDELSKSIVFRLLSEVVNHRIFGAFLFSFGLVNLAFYCSNIYIVRQIFALCQVFVWTFIAFFVLKDFTPAIGVVVVPIAVLTSILNYFRLNRLRPQEFA